jgi:hypothetical protein
MKIAIMQPYFMPYIGYFQLMKVADEFIVYDDIKFTKKGWINRNRILVNGSDAYITLPLKKGSDYLAVNERYLADSWTMERKKMLNRIHESYRKAPQFDAAFSVVESCILCNETNLFSFIFNVLNQVKEYLEIKTPLIISSAISGKEGLKAEEKVIDLCKMRAAHTYFNPIGGLDLYQKEHFRKEMIDLLFLQTSSYQYRQFDHEFVAYLSIIDEMMFNSKDKIKEHLNVGFSLVQPNT